MPYVTSSTLAYHLFRTPAAIVRMANRLAEAGYLEHEPYKGVRLTSSGELEALHYLRHHRLCKVFLHGIMGYGWEELQEDADALAEKVSQVVVNRVEVLTQYPKFCPHGEPIPDAALKMPHLVDIPLCELAVGSRGTIQRVLTRDPDRLIYLREIGIIPGVQMTLMSRAPFNGPLRLQIGHYEQVIGVELGQEICVTL